MKREFGCFLLFLLLLLTACDGERGREMSALLDRADSLNRAYVPMTGGLDSLLRDAADYYDRHGTSNEQMRAHYLLGCAYRDMGEAPAALQSYQDAVDRADTMSADCDMKRLMSVYGQMATLFHYQNLPTDEQKAILQVRNCARRQKDTLTYIRSIELMVKPYFLQHDTMSMLKVLQQARQLYTKYGYLKEASSIYPSIIEIYINKDSLSAAKDLMDVFETKSGLFDSAGHISAGRESYYYLKGLYYNKIHKLDSAELYYRRLLYYDMGTNAYRGLLSVYKKKNNIDTVNKYVHLYEDAINYEQEALETQTVHQMSSMYNYQRFSRKADMESRKAARLKYYFLLSIFFVAIVIFVAVVISINLAHKRKVQEKDTKRLKQDYTEAIAKKEQLAIEMEMLRKNHEQLIVSEQEAKNMIEVVQANNNQLLKTKEKEIAELNEKIRKYAIRLLNSTETEGDNLQFALFIEEFHKKATRKKNTSLPQRTEWEQLVRFFSQTQPGAFAAIGREQTLSPQELRACILLLMKFTNGEIISLLDISSQGMTNIRARINEKLFGESKASSLSYKLKKISIV